MSDLPNFDLAAVTERIVTLEAEAQHALADAQAAATADFKSRSEVIADLLWAVQQNAPKSLKSVCEQAKIGRSRRKQLLQIGSGRKSIVQVRAETKVRVRRSRAKAKAATVAAPRDEAESTTGNGTDPDESAARMKKAHAANEASTTKPKPATDPTASATATKATGNDDTDAHKRADERRAAELAKFETDPVVSAIVAYVASLPNDSDEHDYYDAFTALADALAKHLTYEYMQSLSGALDFASPKPKKPPKSKA